MKKIIPIKPEIIPKYILERAKNPKTNLKLREYLDNIKMKFKKFEMSESHSPKLFVRK
tara:strand:+ start:147 stop:320 length:174 start_codon:yes stop_codon:yes gene_type:complete